MPDRSFTYVRTIRFQETDAAGVVYFSNVLSLCHEAYEASLDATGIDLKTFFSAGHEATGVAVPVVHAEVNFFRPLFCGDAIAIQLTSHQLGPDSFKVAYEVMPSASDGTGAMTKPMARASTRHVCIDAQTRKRHPLTTDLLDWLAETG